MSRRIVIPRSPAFQTYSDDSDIEDVFMSSPIFRPSPSPPVQRLVSPAQAPTVVFGSSATSPTGLASRGYPTTPSSPAANFIQEHTLPDFTVSDLEECPICLDTYSSERCVRITRIQGCTHHIGKKCLEQLLRNKPDEEKKCPMCRSVWIKGPVQSAREHERPSDPIEIIRAISQSLLATDEHGRAPVESRAEGRDLRSSDRWSSRASRQTQPLPSIPSPVINLESDSYGDNVEKVADDSVFGTQLADYTTLACDFEAVRDRTKETTGLSNQRRREMREACARQRASSRPSGTNPTPNSRPVGPGSMSVRDARPVGGVGVNRSLSPHGNPLRSIGKDRNGVPQRSATMGHPNNKTRVQSTRERHTSQTFANYRLPSASLYFSPAPNGTQAHGTHSPAPPSLSNPSHTTLRAPDQRDSQLRKTQLHLAQRERDLDVRQARLVERETSLAAREKRVVEREKRAEKALAKTKRHWDELEMMVKRQREEARRKVE